MHFGTWDNLLNLVFLLFWYGIWSEDRRRAAFNPYLGPLAQLFDRAVGYLRPVAFGLSDRTVGAIALGFLLVFRAAAAASGAQWQLAVGFYPARVDTTSFSSCLIFSVLSFAVFLFHVWGISLIYLHSRQHATYSNPAEALSELSRPFSDVRVDLRPPVLVAVGTAIALVAGFAGMPAWGFGEWSLGSGLLATVVRSFILGLAAWTGVLGILRTALILFIVGSWVSMFTQSHALMHLCREWLDFILGPLRRYPLQIGMLDLTPIVMIFALDFLYKFLMYVLLNSYLKLL